MAKPNPRAAQREQQEPQEMHRPLPVPMKILMLVMTVWGAGYFLTVGTWPLSAGDQRTPLAAVSAAAVDGGTVFAGNCSACHQASGQGLPGVFPSLVDARWVTGPAEVPVQILLHGIVGDIEVKGEVYNGVMPAFDQLSDAEIAAVVNYIRSQWGNQAEPVSEQLVAEQRARFADRGQPWQGGTDIEQTLAIEF